MNFLQVQKKALSNELTQAPEYRKNTSKKPVNY